MSSSTREAIDRVVQGMASSQLVKEPPVGAILWIKKLSHSEDGETYGLPSDYFMHPCVVLHLSVSRNGFAHIYVVRTSCFTWKAPEVSLPPRSTHDSGEQITSKSSRNINDLPLPAHVRRQHVPIYPKPFNNLLPDLQLRLARNVELRKESYVNTQKVYTFPLSMLESYDRRRPVKDFCFDPASVGWLRRKAFGEPLLDIQIQPNIAPASTDTLPNTYNTFQPTPAYGAVLQRAQVPPLHTVVPSARLQPVIITSSTSRSSNNNSSSSRITPPTPPSPSPPPLDMDELRVLVAGVLVLLATAASIVFGIALWAINV
jgi:hypothetical protein